MAKGIVYAKKGVLQGVFTNKKNFWRDLEKIHGDIEGLMVKLNVRKPVPLTYAKLVKLLGERKMLRIYDKEDIKKSIREGTLEVCASVYNLWEVEINQHYCVDWTNDGKYKENGENNERKRE